VTDDGWELFDRIKVLAMYTPYDQYPAPLAGFVDHLRRADMG
jgi:hypothetical protein